MLYVSLGCNCYVSWTLRRLQLQTNSFPFDWINLSNFNFLQNIINTGFFEIINNWDISDFPSDLYKDNIFLYKNFNLRFPHEYDVNPDINIDNIIIRYQRRLDRFYESIRTNNVIFIRLVEEGYGNYPSETSATYEDSELSTVNFFRSICGHNNFKIIIFSKNVNFNFFPISPNIIVIKGAIPFENGFYEYNSNLVNGDLIFEFYKNIFNHEILLKSFRDPSCNFEMQSIHDSYKYLVSI
jgi:hypothetical protein